MKLLYSVALVIVLTLCGWAWLRQQPQNRAPASPVATGTSGEIEITYIANEGFLLAAAGKKVLIDALFREGVAGYETAPVAVREKLEKAIPPFAQTDLLLASHFHADHFDPLSVAEHLRHNPTALFVSTTQAVARLQAVTSATEAVKARAIGLTPPEGERRQINHQGIEVELLLLHHGRNRPIENLGLLIHLDGRKLLHIGDTEATAADFAQYNLTRDKLDFAFVPYWHLRSEGMKKTVREQINPRHLIVMHLPPPDSRIDFTSQAERARVLADIMADFPNAVIFAQPMEQKTFP